MTNVLEQGLLPTGMTDLLPGDAAFEANVVERLMACFASHGFERVKPPLLEFEDSLLSGSGAAMASQTFRLMDPVSQRMMGLRADMTLQVARIATSRLKNAPRPLKLSYAGEVLRVKGSQLRPERQFGQVGAELIGSADPAADAEVILMAADALETVGVPSISVDIALPTLVPALCRSANLDSSTRANLRAALDRKDSAGVTQLKSRLGDTLTSSLTGLLKAMGPAAAALAAFERLPLTGEAKAAWDSLKDVVARVGAAAPSLTLTIDPVENRGFEYHSGVTFTFFAKGVRGELGSGGRYQAGNDSGEPATGLTLFMDTVLQALPAEKPKRRVFLPLGTADVDGRRLRSEGWMTVQGLSEGAGAEAEARRLKCGHVWLAGHLQPIGG